MSRDTLDALTRFKAARALPTWDHVVERLLKEAGEEGDVSARRPTASPPPAPSPTRCSTRATCSTRTARRRRRTRCGGSSVCSFPRRYAEADGSERSAQPHRVHRRPRALDPRLTVRVRCLQVQRRIDRGAVDGTAGSSEVAELDVDGARCVPWDEAVEHEIDLAGRARCSRSPERDARGARRAARRRRDREPLRSADGTELRAAGCAAVRAGRRRRARRAPSGPTAPARSLKVAVTVENVTDWSTLDAHA